MSQQIIYYIDNSTSFTYDVEQNIIQNQRTNGKWVNELADICTLLSMKGFSYIVDESYNITDVRSE